MFTDREEKLDFVEFLVLREQLNKYRYPYPSTTQQITSVLGFLQSFRPSLRSTLPCFEALGIYTVQDLSECTNDPSATIDRLEQFVGSGEISLLQLKVIEEGLSQIAQGTMLLKGV